MLGIGFLALLGVGMAVSMGSGDDGVEIEQDNDTQDDVVNPHQGEQDLLDFGDFGFAPSDEISADDMQRINDFIVELQQNPSDDAPARFQEFLDALEAEKLGGEIGGDEEPSEEGDEEPVTPDNEDGGTEGGDDGEDTTDDVARPPMGDEFRDPLKIAEEEDAPRSPEELVAVLNDAGEIADALVLTQNLQGAETDYTVTAPDGTHDINVGYNAEHTFLIEYSDETSSITAGLNSTLEGPEGNPVLARSTTEDDEGNFITEESYRFDFGGSTSITLNVDADDIGEHVAQVSLINPADSLSFEFDADVNGNFHLFFHESETGEAGDTSTMLRAFVVQTSSTQSSLSDAEIAQIVEEGLERTATTNVIAEIYLGDDSLVVEGGEGVDVVINDFINNDPRINSNISFTSVTHHDEDTADPGTTGGEDDDPGQFDDPFDFDIPFF